MTTTTADICTDIKLGDVRAILLKVDYLGFDTALEAVQAIVLHDDWQERWIIEAGELTGEEFETLLSYCGMLRRKWGAM